MISIIVPCYNEQEVIREMYSRLSGVLCGAGEDFEMIFVDDGSRDKTPAILKELSQGDKRLKYIFFSRNFGKEAAMLAGLTYSGGDYVAIMDADLQHPPELILQMLDKARQGYDQVIAKRNRKGDSAIKTFYAKMYYKLVNMMVDVKLTDGIGDFRVLSRKAVNALLSMQEYNRFSKGLFSWIGFEQATVEYQNATRAAGETKWSFKKLLQYGIDGIISFNNKPLRICLTLGALTVGLSIAYLLYLFIMILINGAVDVPGYFTIIAAVSLFGGIQLISIGIIGEYIGRIYYEVKNRPHYLVKSTNIEEKE
ncbi:MAG: glycosyltransferase family 2 protein [Clostridia bacterium]|nr:glycosyltransferase family 2 protein [Clostridia bacterium]